MSKTAPYLFRDPSLWLGRLQNILTAIDETIDQTEMQIQVREKVSSATNMFQFQLMQIKSLKSMLEGMKTFGKETLIECTSAVLEEKDNPRLDLLRTAFHELTTDLNLVQRALNQRLWAVKLSADDAKASEGVNKQLIEDLKKWLKDEIKNTSQQQKPMGKKDNDRRTGWNTSNALGGLGAAVTIDTSIDKLFEHKAFEFVGAKISSALDVEVRSKQTQTLIYADILANYALLPAQSLIQQSTDPVEVVTYFTENNVSVRILPYYPGIILVGLPYSTGFLAPDGLTNLSSYLEEASKDKLQPSAQIPWEFLSLPHEIGHYLFWNGFSKDGNVDEILRKKLLKNPAVQKSSWQYHWLEELFADTFKCMLMGPVAVLGLQVMLSDAADEEQLFHDNGYHPIPAIRPLLASFIVEKLYPSEYTDILEILDENWNKLLLTWGVQFKDKKISIGGKAESEVKGQWTNHMHRDQPGEDLVWGTPEELSYADIESKIAPVIDEISNVLSSVKTFKQPESLKKSNITSLTFGTGNSKKGPLFPMPKEFNNSKTLDSLIKELFDHLKPRLTDFSVPAVNKVDNRGSKPGSNRLPAVSGADWVKRLEEDYIANWGDKGPRGGGTIGV